MNWLILINLACGVDGAAGHPDLKNRPNCVEVYKKCIEEVHSFPESKERDLSLDDVAMLFELKPHLVKHLCK